MTELERFIAEYPGGNEALGRWLLANPIYSAFNVLWKSPSQITVMCDYFGLSTLADAGVFAAQMQDGSAWTTRRDQLVEWLNPRPGFFRDQLVPVISNESLQDLIRSGLINLEPNCAIHVNDATFVLASYEQAKQFMFRCPAWRFPRDGEWVDCDDFTDMVRSWRSEHGLGRMAMGWASYMAYDRNGTLLGSHAIALFLTSDRHFWLGDGEVRGLFPSEYTMLGGMWNAAKIVFNRIII